MTFTDKAAVAGKATVIGMYAAAIAFFSAAKIGEYRQPIERIDGATVIQIEQNCYDPNTRQHCYQLFVTDSQKEVTFWTSERDNPVNVGDSVDMVVQKTFFSPNSFKGIEITTLPPPIQ